jgi:hypothetical protein
LAFNQRTGEGGVEGLDHPNVWWRGEEETFELVIFLSYEIEEAPPCWGETSVRLGSASRERLDGATVEVLVGEKV